MSATRSPSRNSKRLVSWAKADGRQNRTAKNEQIKYRYMAASGCNSGTINRNAAFQASVLRAGRAGAGGSQFMIGSAPPVKVSFEVPLDFRIFGDSREGAIP